MKVKTAICRGKIRTLEDAMEAWKVDPDGPRAARDTEDLIQLCLDLAGFACDWVRAAFVALESSQIEQFDDVGRTIKDAVDRVMVLGRRVEQFIRYDEHMGRVAAGTEKVGGALAQIVRAQEDLDNRWPFVDWDDVERGRAEVAQGLVLSAEESYRELVGEDYQGGQQTDRQLGPATQPLGAGPGSTASRSPVES